MKIYTALMNSPMQILFFSFRQSKVILNLVDFNPQNTFAEFNYVLNSHIIFQYVLIKRTKINMFEMQKLTHLFLYRTKSYETVVVRPFTVLLFIWSNFKIYEFRFF